MSAIVGICYPDGRSVDPATLRRMVDILAHRGPDGAGVWCDGPVGLGHRMLWTTPESLHEHLPLRSHRGDLVITADARIDNRDELIAILELGARPAGAISDSELILAAYERWGARCPEYLLGDFAFAVWDARQQTLFCARDHFGVRPFYYHWQLGRLFVCGSEIKALLCVPGLPRRLNEVRVGDYLSQVFDDTVSTFYQGILRLPPAHRLVLTADEMRVERYWSLDPECELRLGSDAEYAEAFRAHFVEAVRCRLRSAFPIGSLLSGGLDSSSITCVARKLLGSDDQTPLPTFSAVFDDVAVCDERAFIDTVLAQGGLEPHYAYPDSVSPLADLERVHWHDDEVLAAPNLFIHRSLYAAARQRGVRVLLDGIDGDTVVSHGLAYLTELTRTRQWSTLADEVRALAQHFDCPPGRLLEHYSLPLLADLARRGRLLSLLRAADEIGRPFMLPGRRLAWQYGVRPLVPQPLRRVRGWLRGGPPAESIVRGEFARRIALEQRLRTLTCASRHLPQTAREEHYRNLLQGVIPSLLEILNKAAPAFSIEPRYPFFDRRLVEFCLALPAEQKVHQGWTRVVLRRAMGGTLPVEVQWRKGKSDLGPNFTHTLLAFERERLDQIIANEVGPLEPYVDFSALHGLYQRYISRRTRSDELTIWQVCTLALWLQDMHLAPAR